MPRGDGTGPAGMGAMTGRGAGFCVGFRVPGFLNSLPGRGLGFGSGRSYRRTLWAAGVDSRLPIPRLPVANRKRMK